MTSRWSLEFSWHCLARLCSPQRSPIGLTSVEALHAAHDRLLPCSSVRNSSSTSVTGRSYARARSATRRTCCSLPLRKYRDDGLVDVPAALVAALQERS